MHSSFCAFAGIIIVLGRHRLLLGFRDLLLQWNAGTQSSGRPVRSFAGGERVGHQAFS